MLPYAEKLNFNLLPEFRGPNNNANPHCTLACGSEYAKQDIQDAIDYVLKKESIDKENVFLLGLSGGGYMALLMAGKRPEYFKAVGAYVPITDLTAWVDQNIRYSQQILDCCSNSKEEMLKRSPISYLDRIAEANIKVFHGKYDSSVPVSYSIIFSNQMMEKYPSAKCYLDIFDGGHEIDMEAAMYWFLSQYESNAKATVLRDRQSCMPENRKGCRRYGIRVSEQ